jgi:hypothetical protein
MEKFLSQGIIQDFSVMRVWIPNMFILKLCTVAINQTSITWHPAACLGLFFVIWGVGLPTYLWRFLPLYALSDCTRSTGRIVAVKLYSNCLSSRLVPVGIISKSILVYTCEILNLRKILEFMRSDASMTVNTSVQVESSTPRIRGRTALIAVNIFSCIASQCVFFHRSKSSHWQT